MAEPPKLYGPHAPVIVSQTSDSRAHVPDNLENPVGCPRGNPNHPRNSIPGSHCGDIAALQHFS